MAREVLHRIFVNDSPRVFRLPAADYYHHPLNKKLLAGRTDPAQVMATKFHYLLAKDGPVRVAFHHLGINLGICTQEELDANPLWAETNHVFRSTKAKPQTLKIKTSYVGSNLVLLAPVAGVGITAQMGNQLMDFATAFFYVVDHFPSATEANVRDSNMWKMWLGLFVAGYAPDGKALHAEMVDHLRAIDHQMVKWYPRR